MFYLGQSKTPFFIDSIIHFGLKTGLAPVELNFHFSTWHCFNYIRQWSVISRGISVYKGYFSNSSYPSSSVWPWPQGWFCIGIWCRLSIFSVCVGVGVRVSVRQFDFRYVAVSLASFTEQFYFVFTNSNIDFITEINLHFLYLIALSLLWNHHNL